MTERELTPETAGAAVFGLPQGEASAAACTPADRDPCQPQAEGGGLAPPPPEAGPQPSRGDDPGPSRAGATDDPNQAHADLILALGQVKAAQQEARIRALLGSPLSDRPGDG